MSELQLVEIYNNEITSWDFDTLKVELEKRLKIHENIIYTEDSIKSAKDDRALLNKVKTAIEDKRKAYKNECLKPYNDLEPKVKELVAIIEDKRSLIDETVKGFENKMKEEKKEEIKKYYDKKSFVLGDLSESLFEKLLDSKWLNASTSRSKYEEEVQTAINKALSDVNIIKSWASPFEEVLLETYIETVSVDMVDEKNKEFLDGVKKAGIISGDKISTDDTDEKKEDTIIKSGEGTLIRINANEIQMSQVFDFLKAIGVSYEVVNEEL